MPSRTQNSSTAARSCCCSSISLSSPAECWRRVTPVPGSGQAWGGDGDRRRLRLRRMPHAALALGHEDVNDHNALRHQEAEYVSASLETQQTWTQPARREKRAHGPGSPAARAQGGFHSAWRTCDEESMRAFAAGQWRPRTRPPSHSRNQSSVFAVAPKAPTKPLTPSDVPNVPASPPG